ncbi:MAG: hypothetical protein ACI9TP_002539, partial [Candidatus Azotimanducaceae bacterium]
MQQAVDYPIGTPGTAWSASDIAAWFAHQSIQRLFADDVVAKLNTLTDDFL